MDKELTAVSFPACSNLRNVRLRKVPKTPSRTEPPPSDLTKLRDGASKFAHWWHMKRGVLGKLENKRSGIFWTKECLDDLIAFIAEMLEEISTRQPDGVSPKLILRELLRGVVNENIAEVENHLRFINSCIWSTLKMNRSKEKKSHPEGAPVQIEGDIELSGLLGEDVTSKNICDKWSSFREATGTVALSPDQVIADIKSLEVEMVGYKSSSEFASQLQREAASLLEKIASDNSQLNKVFKEDEWNLARVEVTLLKKMVEAESVNEVWVQRACCEILAALLDPDCLNDGACDVDFCETDLISKCKDVLKAGVAQEDRLNKIESDVQKLEKTRENLLKDRVDAEKAYQHFKSVVAEMRKVEENVEETAKRDFWKLPGDVEYVVPTEMD